MFGYQDQKLKEISANHTAKEIKQQPRLWQETVEIIEDNKDKINKFISKIDNSSQARIIFTGAGTSAFVGDTAVPYLDKKLAVKVESIATTDIVSNPKDYLHQEETTLLISCARSGNSPESLATVRLAEKIVDDLYQIMLTCNRDGDLAQESIDNDRNLVLFMPKDAHDKGFAMTGSFTTMLLSSLLIFDLDNLEQSKEIVKKIIKLGTDVLENNVEILKEISNYQFNRLIYLGSSSLKGLATEAALKMLELTRGKVMSSYNSALGFRHGPKSMVNDQTLAINYLSNDPYTRKYETDLVKEMAAESGDHKIVVISEYQDDELAELVDIFIPLSDQQEGELEEVYLAFPYILNAQMLALFKSIQLGNTPDNPAPDGSVNRVVKGVKIYPWN